VQIWNHQNEFINFFYQFAFKTQNQFLLKTKRYGFYAFYSTQFNVQITICRWKKILETFFLLHYGHVMLWSFITIINDVIGKLTIIIHNTSCWSIFWKCRVSSFDKRFSVNDIQIKELFLYQSFWLQTIKNY
jgi:hypothetical protein